MTEAQVFVLADQALNNVIQQINDGQWELRLPEWFQRGRTQDDITLRQLINYHCYDEAWVPAMLAGQRMEDINDIPADMEADLVGNDPRGAYRELMNKAAAAAGRVTNLDAVAHLSFGDFTVRDYFYQITSFRGFRAYDIAKLIGADTRLPDELVQGLWDELSPHFEEWRAIGVYPAEVPVPDGAALQDRLLAKSGRQP